MSDIEVRHLSKSFDLKGVKVEALKDINLSIKPGDIYGIIGMSGAGKSTLVRCLNFLERPTEGEVLVGGKDLSTLTEKELRKQRQEIAMIFQHFNLLMQKNVIDNICFPLLLRGEKKADARRRAMELLKLVDLEEKANAYPSQLSGGQKQRVAIARALASDPKILLCDEATSALDPQTTASILALLKLLNKRFYWDANENLLIYTTATSVIKAGLDSKTYDINKSSNTKDYVIAKLRGDKLYIALDFIKEYTALEYKTYKNPNRVVLTYKFGDKQKWVQADEEAKLRF